MKTTRLLIIILLQIVTFTLIVGKPNASTLSYLHTNHQGSVIEITNEQGEVVQSDRYFPYGEGRNGFRSQNTEFSERKYTGQIKDVYVGLYHYNARYYDPLLSNFISPDPVDDLLNKYIYVSGNPINYSDPTGLREISCSDIGYEDCEEVPIIEPPEDEDDPITQVPVFDMLVYFVTPGWLEAGDIAILNTGERQQLQLGANYELYLTKNQQYEQRSFDGSYIYLLVDTSPGNGQFYTVRGPWLPRYWNVGQNFQRNEDVQFMDKESGQAIEAGTYSSESTIYFKAHYAQWTSPGGVTVSDVVEVEWIVDGQPDETYWYARGLGLVGWHKHEDGRQSFIVELIPQGQQEDNVMETIPGP